MVIHTAPRCRSGFITDAQDVWPPGEALPLGHENNLHSRRHPRLQRHRNIGRCSRNKNRTPGGIRNTCALWVSSPVGLSALECPGLTLSLNRLSVSFSISRYLWPAAASGPKLTDASRPSAVAQQ